MAVIDSANPRIRMRPMIAPKWTGSFGVARERHLQIAEDLVQQGFVALDPSDRLIPLDLNTAVLHVLHLPPPAREGDVDHDRLVAGLGQDEAHSRLLESSQE